jgi:hypothetical protein
MPGFSFFFTSRKGGVGYVGGVKENVSFHANHHRRPPFDSLEAQAIQQSVRYFPESANIFCFLAEREVHEPATTWFTPWLMPSLQKF